ncbi:2-oxoglutarate-dependent ethylene/succinate-forming enzyme [Pseudooceanicola marinus]|uniref:2-oxoglutarate-dependent ethylene/succinate-forming enzyme n=1 Tax=Pseudooceanicola marinus TaxID=396013 RepID=A0A1X6Y517_9RHOB|nr:2-oxoglutarate and iron-dependent oxygenase domain-containing protein [Pseudooceanicola marinus]PJE33383.1 isopenicillin N synthase family oxygenase [Pseudooceanicola marinus]SLN10427.1 2-oxoglutarate-dependent ethylene/succinate-forming enzyme [Pseudooceanicola marinus]
MSLDDSAAPDFPILDLGAFAAADAAGRAAIGAEVDRTCRETGFLAVGNHGVPEEVIAGLWSRLTTFFDLPPEEKQKLKPAPGDPYGYLGPGSEALAKSRGEDTPPDLKESFNGGPQAVPEGETDPQALAFCYAPTPWPEAPEGFREAWTAYYAEMEALAARIMEVFAVALDLPQDHFADVIDAPVSGMRALNYPAQEVAPEEGQLRAGAHTDYGSLTILLPEPGSRGLEILTPEGTWRGIPPVEGAFVINIGDLMTLWTGGEWVSTLHRVVTPPEWATRRRMSIAYFHQPNWHAEIRPLAGEGEPVLSGPYLMGKFNAANS